MDELITRDEVVALLFKINDIGASLEEIEVLLRNEDGEEEDES